MAMNNNNSEFTEWHESFASELTAAYNITPHWGKEMLRMIDSMALAWHMGFSLEDFKAGRVSAEIVKRAENAERALKEANRRYGVASATIGQLRAEMALLREKNRELQENPLKVVVAPRVFDDPNVEPPRDLTLRSAKPLWTQQRDETFDISFVENKKPYIPEGRWWCDDDPKGRHTAMHSDWEYWVKSYGPFTEVINVAD